MGVLCHALTSTGYAGGFVFGFSSQWPNHKHQFNSKAERLVTNSCHTSCHMRVTFVLGRYIVLFIECCAVEALANEGWPTVSPCGGRATYSSRGCGHVTDTPVLPLVMM